MTNDAVEYRGYRILSDVREVERTGFWRARAAIALARDVVTCDMVQTIDGSYFASQEEAADYVIVTAKDWIDKAIEGENFPQPRLKRSLSWRITRIHDVF
jgi:hypothetical protein